MREGWWMKAGECDANIRGLDFKVRFSTHRQSDAHKKDRLWKSLKKSTSYRAIAIEDY